MIGGGFFGPFTMAAQMLGVEDFMVELMDSDEEDISKLVDFAGEIVVAYLEDLIDNGLDGDLTDVRLTLVAGRPVSFRYPLYEPQQPIRPTIEDQPPPPVMPSPKMARREMAFAAAAPASMDALSLIGTSKCTITGIPTPTVSPARGTKLG
jgi:uroporphyrinogen-III decarboxylase